MNFSSKLSSSFKHIFSKPQLLYFFLAWALCAVEIWCIVGKIGYGGFGIFSLRTIVYSIIWGGVFSLPYILLKPSWRWIQLLVYVWLVFFILVSTLYLRNFITAISLDEFFHPEGINAFTIAAAQATIKISDSIFIGALILQISAFFLMRKTTLRIKISKRLKLIFTIPLVLILGVMQIHSIFFTEELYFLGKPRPFTFRQLCQFSSARPLEYFSKAGYFETYALQAVYYFIPYENVTASEVAYINNIITENKYKPLTSEIDSITAKNKNKNLYYIIVESLNTAALGKNFDGIRFTPTLDSLVKSPDVITFDSMKEQVSMGVSSDGQFIYNTGLLPLTNMTTAYCTSPFPSLAKEINYKNAIEIIGESGNTWNHKKTTLSYGYDKLIPLSLRVTNIQSDEKILSKALDVINTSKKPMFAFITTLSMHQPYTHIQAPKGWPLRQQAYEYLVKTQIFDKALNQFITGLKQKGLYENSIIVLASDHNAPFNTILDKNVYDGRIMLMIINSGLKGGVNSSVIGQIDVYPTILDVMGVRNPTWPGLGASLLREIPGFALMNDGSIVGDSTKMGAANRQRKAREITSKMILNKTIGTLAEPRKAN